MEERGVVKTSAIFISCGGKTELYHTLEEVPPRLRKKVVRLTTSGAAATVLIADRRGLQELLRARRDQMTEPAGAGSVFNHPAVLALRRRWLEILLVGGLPLLLWLIFQVRL
jgi:hypothetical protein